MAPSQAKKEQHQIPAEAAMAGILALLVDEREERLKESKLAKKTEVLLGAAGLSVEDIAAATGKNPGAVRMAIRRGQAK